MTHPSTCYSSLPVLTDFGAVADPAHYVPLPDDWFVGLTDVVDSSTAIGDGRYKAVNMAGAAAIAAVINALDGIQDFPFVFAGDGAVLALPPEFRERAEAALAATARWVEEDLDLSLRATTIGIGEIRQTGRDVRVARFSASDAATYALFAGGGISWAEQQMKAGALPLFKAETGSRPDLTGLSCRWAPLTPQADTILTVLVVPARGDDDPAYRSTIETVIQTLEASNAGGRPVPPSGPRFAWPPEGLHLEARATRGRRGLFAQKLRIGLIALLAWALDRTGTKLGDFDPVAYRTYTALNADFRKYQDGIRMTVDCTAEMAERIERILAEARDQGALAFGLVRQEAAVMTCFVPSIHSDTHFHFVDGAGGGYAAAAAALKEC
ncbi:DUF3095 family protein [Amorphus sp. 3PC139-8]|uniref:DUF3095 family protein n=1 Tax=Amorphus sp. 3PC139-8 TaxID=2735676 RepID=UPI00345CAEB9